MEFDVDAASGAVIGAPVELALAARNGVSATGRNLDALEFTWWVILVNRHGGVVRRKAGEGTVPIAGRITPTQPVRCVIHGPTGWPPSTPSDRPAERTEVKYSLETYVVDGNERAGDAREIFVNPAPAETPASELVDAEVAADLLHRRRRTKTGVSSVGFVIILFLGMAVGFPIGFSVADGDAELPAVVGTTMAVVAAIFVANWLLYGRVDKHPFDVERSLVRSGESVTVRLATPPSAPLVASLATRTELYRRVGNSRKTTVEWSLGPLSEVASSSVGAVIAVPPTTEQTVDTPEVKVDHWVRLQPASQATTDQRFQRDRSDRPLIVVT
ncbi:MAG: hypothetical protein AB8G26_00955 [Ilumatobacter sp.]